MIDLVGKKFRQLIIVKRADKDRWGKYRWLCVCDCGKTTLVLASNLKNGNTHSCGCLRKANRIKHGHSPRGKSSRTYESWHQMIQRCTNHNNKKYPIYGGRGITFCQRWMKFENFLEDMGEPPTNKHTLDRMDNDGNYCKSNCQWATYKQQNRNTRRNHMETYKGKTQCIAAWAEETGIQYNTIRFRLKRGWSLEKTLTVSVRR